MRKRWYVMMHEDTREVIGDITYMSKNECAERNFYMTMAKAPFKWYAIAEPK